MLKATNYMYITEGASVRGPSCRLLDKSATGCCQSPALQLAALKRAEVCQDACDNMSRHIYVIENHCPIGREAAYGSESASRAREQDPDSPHRGRPASGDLEAEDTGAAENSRPAGKPRGRWHDAWSRSRQQRRTAGFARGTALILAGVNVLLYAFLGRR